jgi:hypothetical protein
MVFGENQGAGPFRKGGQMERLARPLARAVIIVSIIGVYMCQEEINDAARELKINDPEVDGEEVENRMESATRFRDSLLLIFALSFFVEQWL